MNTAFPLARKLSLSLLSLISAAHCFAADSAKVKVLETCDKIDPKTVRITEAKAKSIPTQDPEHRKAIELVMDYAKPGAWSGLGKDFPEHLNLKKYAAIRFWVRSDVGTSFSFGIGGDYKRRDGRGTNFYGGGFKATETWTQITIPLDKFRRGGLRNWNKEKKEWTEIRGGDPMEDEDFEGISRWGLSSDINARGASTKGHLMFDAFELVEK